MLSSFANVDFSKLTQNISEQLNELTKSVKSIKISEVKENIQNISYDNVKKSIKKIPKKTREYFNPPPPKYEMKSIVRLDDGFFVSNDLENYVTPGINDNNDSTLKVSTNFPKFKIIAKVEEIKSWNDFELCVEDDGLFDLTENGSYTTTTNTNTTYTTYTTTNSAFTSYSQSTQMTQYEHKHRNSIDNDNDINNHNNNNNNSNNNNNTNNNDNASSDNRISDKSSNNSVKRGKHEIKLSVHNLKLHDDDLQSDTDSKDNSEMIITDDSNIDNINDEEMEEPEPEQLNLDEESPKKFFKNLKEFRKSIVKIRKASGFLDVNQKSVSTAPPTLLSQGSYDERLLNLDEQIINNTTKSNNNDNNNNNNDNNKTSSIIKNDNDIAPVHDESRPETPALKARIHHAVEGTYAHQYI